MFHLKPWKQIHHHWLRFSWRLINIRRRPISFNALPTDVKQSLSRANFQKKLDTHLFTFQFMPTVLDFVTVLLFLSCNIFIQFAVRLHWARGTLSSSMTMMMITEEQHAKSMINVKCICICQSDGMFGIKPGLSLVLNRSQSQLDLETRF